MEITPCEKEPTRHFAKTTCCTNPDAASDEENTPGDCCEYDQFFNKIDIESPQVNTSSSMLDVLHTVVFPVFFLPYQVEHFQLKGSDFYFSDNSPPHYTADPHARLQVYLC